jgi:cytidylate kinase
MASFVVAVDGPSGSGKSSVCKEAARRLGFGYLDTGAGYRAFALHASKCSSLDQAIETFDYSISLDPSDVVVKISGEDFSQEIRTAKVAELVIPISRETKVRNLQRDDARSRIDGCESQGIIVEGRDITTVVCPDAPVRILLTADPEVRLARRSTEESESQSNQIARDSSDSQVAEFLRPASGVTLIDTTHLDFEQSVEALLDEIERVRK